MNWAEGFRDFLYTRGPKAVKSMGSLSSSLLVISFFLDSIPHLPQKRTMIKSEMRVSLELDCLNAPSFSNISSVRADIRVTGYIR